MGLHDERFISLCFIKLSNATFIEMAYLNSEKNEYLCSKSKYFIRLHRIALFENILFLNCNVYLHRY